MERHLQKNILLAPKMMEQMRIHLMHNLDVPAEIMLKVSGIARQYMKRLLLGKIIVKKMMKY